MGTNHGYSIVNADFYAKTCKQPSQLCLSLPLTSAGGAIAFWEEKGHVDVKPTRIHKTASGIGNM